MLEEEVVSLIASVFSRQSFVGRMGRSRRLENRVESMKEFVYGEDE